MRHRLLFPLIFLLFLTAVSCLAPGTNPGAAGGPAGGPTGTELAPKTSPSGAAGAAGASGEKEGTSSTEGGDIASNQPGPGGSLPSGPPAPTVDWDDGWMCLNARYQRLCKEGFQQRVRIELKGKISSSDNDPTACAFNGKRALRIIYPSATTGRGPASSWYIDVPVAPDGGVEAFFSTSDPESMDYYLVPKEQETATEEKSCANNVCVDADQNGVQDGDRCAVITLALMCDRDAPPPKLGRTVIEVHPHNQGPLTECTQFFIKEAMPIEKMFLKKW